MTTSIAIYPSRKKAQTARLIGIELLIESGWDPAHARRLWIGPAVWKNQPASALNAPASLIRDSVVARDFARDIREVMEWE